MKQWKLRNGVGEVCVSSLGAVIRYWKVNKGKTAVDLLDGYANDQENFTQAGARMAVLAPWSNRIADARYRFAGVDYDLDAADDGSREALHGLICDTEFSCVHATDSEINLETIIEPTQGYPWAIKIEVQYCLSGTDGHHLSMTLLATNLSSTPAPITLGWHPYVFYQGGQAKDAKVTIDATSVINTDDALIPLPENRALTKIPATPIVIEAPHDLDTAYTGLRVNENNNSQAWLDHPNGDTTLITMHLPSELSTGSHSVFHVFTGEPLDERACEAIAIEPCLMMTNAFNREEYADIIAVKPGSSRKLQATISHKFADCGDISCE